MGWKKGLDMGKAQRWNFWERAWCFWLIGVRSFEIYFLSFFLLSFGPKELNWCALKEDW